MGLCSSKPNFGDHEGQWNSAAYVASLEEARGDPPESLAICPVDRLPLRFSPGSRMGGTGECARSGEEVDLSGPHFYGQTGDVYVRMEDGPSVYFSPEYDVYDSRTKQRYNSSEPDADGNEHLHTVARELGGNQVADKILSNFVKLGNQVKDEAEEVLDCEWETDGVLEAIFDTEDRNEIESNIEALAKAALDALSQDPVISDIPAPCKVYGDTHGQLRDVLALFNAFGWPGNPDGPNFLFNGDFVDRGIHDVELVCVYFALKVKYPDRVWLNRGNHEDSVMNTDGQFKEHCESFFGPGCKAFEAIEQTFNMLPLGSVIGGKILVVHGGIGHGNWDVNEVRNAQRPLTSEMLDRNVVYSNILWSDPIEDDDPDMEATIGSHPNKDRGGSALTFGWDVTVAFCKRNGLGMIVRSHQCKCTGFGFDVMHDNMLVRVFSARDYDGGDSDNYGSILKITEDPTGLLIVRAQLLKSINE